MQNRNHDLKRHKRIHLAVKPFGCDKCGKTYVCCIYLVRVIQAEFAASPERTLSDVIGWSRVVEAKMELRLSSVSH